MYYTQNDKIEQVTERTLVIGVDIGSKEHYARAFNWRGIELRKRVFSFCNNQEGFESFTEWKEELSSSSGMDKVITGLEPTGHYWINFGRYLQELGVKIAMINPYHVKQTKELDDNSPTKTDSKDPRTIAKLVIEGRYSIPYIPKKLYAELRTATNRRLRLKKDLTSIKNRIQRWLSIYFPEYSCVFKGFDCVSSMLVLKHAPLPEDIIELGAEGINQIWRDAKVRTVGMKRANHLCETAKISVGCSDGLRAARMEIQQHLREYEEKSMSELELMEFIEELCNEIPYSENLLEIKGIGLKTVSGFIAEVGNIRRFDNPKRIQKLAGLAFREHSSGKHKGETTISKRGRKNLRHILFEASMSLVATNPEFKEIHHYYTTRKNNPLTKMQSLIAIANKLIRVFYMMLTTGVKYDGQKMLRDIIRPENAA